MEEAARLVSSIGNEGGHSWQEGCDPTRFSRAEDASTGRFAPCWSRVAPWIAAALGGSRKAGGLAVGGPGAVKVDPWLPEIAGLGGRSQGLTVGLGDRVESAEGHGDVGREAYTVFNKATRFSTTWEPSSRTGVAWGQATSGNEVATAVTENCQGPAARGPEGRGMRDLGVLIRDEGRPPPA